MFENRCSEGLSTAGANGGPDFRQKADDLKRHSLGENKIYKHIRDGGRNGRIGSGLFLRTKVLPTRDAICESYKKNQDTRAILLC